jgi:hypothetical protein
MAKSLQAVRSGHADAIVVESAMLVAERGCMNVIAHHKGNTPSHLVSTLMDQPAEAKPGVECGSGLDAGFPFDENVRMSQFTLVHLGGSPGALSLTAVVLHPP